MQKELGALEAGQSADKRREIRREAFNRTRKLRGENVIDTEKPNNNRSNWTMTLNCWPCSQSNESSETKVPRDKSKPGWIVDERRKMNG